MTDDARAILLGMKERLSKAWIQNDLMGADESVCLLGAGVAAANIPPVHDCNRSSSFTGRKGGGITFTWENTHPLTEALEAVADTLGVPFSELAVWNDTPGRTQTQIIDAIDSTLRANAPTCPPVTEKVASS